MQNPVSDSLYKIEYTLHGHHSEHVGVGMVLQQTINTIRNWNNGF